MSTRGGVDRRRRAVRASGQRQGFSAGELNGGRGAKDGSESDARIAIYGRMEGVRL